ncbi:beta-lactamase class A [Actinopolymorpha cephalotaxi]|uniref:Beta-lactamase class A n=1 Tax=Actinopolymorpha cephalotaxi TaxID=504797 RepID=A0A1I2WYW3_9ACTN|nr:serine hydrolase [Actinopolymorpha cephalotaxi]NYH85211.1 beta-lactamase class A [Actinopolymorpha cephalotaxi]SFH06534.1 beta-lactamase class A [Actinopolymorpha cephalotaxi]
MTVIEEGSRAIQQCFEDAGVWGWLHAVDLHDEDREVGFFPDEQVALASVFKLPLLAAYARMVDAGEIDPVATVTLDPSRRTPGSTGFAAMADPITVSWRDLARSMITVSDNAAADELLDAVGLDRVRALLDDLGLRRTRITGGSRDLFDAVLRESGQPTLAEGIAWLRDSGTMDQTAVLDPENPHSSVGTCRDMTRLLMAIWRDRAASPDQCVYMRTVLTQQIWTQRLAAAFPFDDVVVAGKTGTFIALRHEVGVVEYPNGETYAVAVFTRSPRTRLILPAADAAIAQAAKIAVASLR